MKRIQHKIGLLLFCISLIFGVYTLNFEDQPRTSNDATIVNTTPIC